jgi:hypothetical protein
MGFLLNILNDASSVYEDSGYPGCLPSKQVTFRLISHENTILWIRVELPGCNLEYLFGWFSPAHVSAEDHIVHPLAQTKAAYLFSPQKRRTSPRSVRDYSDLETIN